MTLSALPAYAFDNVAECQAAVAETTREVLQAPINVEQLSEVDLLITSALAKCQNDLEGAKADLGEANTIVKTFR